MEIFLFNRIRYYELVKTCPQKTIILAANVDLTILLFWSIFRFAQ